MIFIYVFYWNITLYCNGKNHQNLNYYKREGLRTVLIEKKLWNIFNHYFDEEFLIKTGKLYSVDKPNIIILVNFLYLYLKKSRERVTSKSLSQSSFQKFI